MDFPNYNSVSSARSSELLTPTTTATSEDSIAKTQNFLTAQSALATKDTPLEDRHIECALDAFVSAKTLSEYRKTKNKATEFLGVRTDQDHFCKTKQGLIQWKEYATEVMHLIKKSKPFQQLYQENIRNLNSEYLTTEENPTNFPNDFLKSCQTSTFIDSNKIAVAAYIKTMFNYINMFNDKYDFDIQSVTEKSIKGKITKHSDGSKKYLSLAISEDIINGGKNPEECFIKLTMELCHDIAISILNLENNAKMFGFSLWSGETSIELDPPTGESGITYEVMTICRISTNDILDTKNMTVIPEKLKKVLGFEPAESSLNLFNVKTLLEKEQQ